jgi:hypothetical protein
MLDRFQTFGFSFLPSPPPHAPDLRLVKHLISRGSKIQLVGTQCHKSLIKLLDKEASNWTYTERTGTVCLLNSLRNVRTTSIIQGDSRKYIVFFIFNDVHWSLFKYRDIRFYFRIFCNVSLSFEDIAILCCIFFIANFNLSMPSGFFTYRQVLHWKILHCAGFVLSVLYGSEKTATFVVCIINR